MQAVEDKWAKHGEDTKLPISFEDIKEVGLGAQQVDLTRELTCCGAGLQSCLQPYAIGPAAVSIQLCSAKSGLQHRHLLAALTLVACC